MNVRIARFLRAKYPAKALCALDHRTASFTGARNDKDISLQNRVRARKPRVRDMVVLDGYDDYLHIFYLVTEHTVYYLCEQQEQEPVCRTEVALSGNLFDDVSAMAKAAINQQETDEGMMQVGDTRVAWIVNTPSVHEHAYVHATVHRERKGFRIAAEIGCCNAEFYNKVLSIMLPVNLIETTSEQSPS